MDIEEQIPRIELPPVTQQTIKSKVIQRLAAVKQPLYMIDEEKVSKVDEIEKQISNILAPPNIQLTTSVLNETTPIEVFQQYSILNFLSQFYIQTTSQILSMALDIHGGNDYTKKGMQIVRQTFNIISATPKMTIGKKLSKLLDQLKKKQMPIRLYLRIILQKTFKMIQVFLQDANYKVSFQAAVKVIFNENCVKFSETDARTLQKYHNELINSKIKQIQTKTTDASNISAITSQVIESTLKQKLRKSFIKSDVTVDSSHWAAVKQQDMINPNKAALERFFNEVSKIKQKVEEMKKETKNETGTIQIL